MGQRDMCPTLKRRAHIGERRECASEREHHPGHGERNVPPLEKSQELGYVELISYAHVEFARSISRDGQICSFGVRYLRSAEEATDLK